MFFLLKNILQYVLYWCKKFQVDGIKFEIMVSKIAKNLNFEKSGIEDFVFAFWPVARSDSNQFPIFLGQQIAETLRI